MSDRPVLAPHQQDGVAERRVRLRQRFRRLRRPAWLGTIRRTTPLSDGWGFDRGTPVDRYFIERFLAREHAYIRGRVLEVADSRYTARYGQDVEQSDIVDIDPNNTSATFVADLAAADAVPSDAFDCFVLTQTLQYVFDLPSAVRHVHRVLRPGGTVLCTVPTASRIGKRYLETEHWRFTTASTTCLFEDAFGSGAVTVRAHGNVLTCVAFLMGMAAEELSERELESHDVFFPLLVTIRATKGL